MAKLSKTAYLTIHGHFYQPPRENPWIERIELQPDAHPFHNWNDRILIQCYQPNAMSRIVDSEGKVMEMVNNFRLLSFDVGPTLMSWLEKYAPMVFHRILEGDQLSRQERSGHGSAIAQVYNHMILPLAEERDQRTQIRWGIYEFKKRFERDPEGIWLPETGASERTLEILIEESLEFTILAPEQAQKIRPLGAPNSLWKDVSDGSIDTTRPYRYFHSRDTERFIDLFFFDRPLGSEIGFGDLLLDAKKLMTKLMNTHHSDRHHSELIHAATDGETFGHHKAFGERVITFILKEDAERHGFKRTNYGEYLEKFPPQFEVKIKPGEGTSWSCAHGVKRWKEDCGCYTGGQPGWNQKWRAPLREAVHFLENRLAEIYEKEGRQIFGDPWKARDGYIQLILDRSAESQKSFFDQHALRSLSEAEKIKASKLLEMERYAMLTETSCGWFFNDLSGLETVQILRYALRALELAAEFGGEGIEKEFVTQLTQAESNLAEFGDGSGVWEKRVKPARVSEAKLVSHYAFRKLFDLPTSNEDFYNHQISERELERKTVEKRTLLMGSVRVTGRTIPESREWGYAIFHEDDSQVQCFVKRLSAGEFHPLSVALSDVLLKKQGPIFLEALKQVFGHEIFFLKDLFPEERQQILWLLSERMRKDFYQTIERLYEENRSRLSLIREATRFLPEELKGILEWMMGERLFQWIQKLDSKVSFEEIQKKGRAILEEAKERGLAVHARSSVEFLSKRLNDCIEKLFTQENPALVQKIEKVLELAKEFDLRLHARIAQDLFFVFAQTVLQEWIDAYKHGERDETKLQTIQPIIQLGSQLGFNMKQYENQLKPPVEVR